MDHRDTQTQYHEISFGEIVRTIKEWWEYLFKKWLVIVLFGIGGSIAGFIFAYFKKPLYTATSTFVLEDEKSSGGLGNLAGLASMAGFEIGDGGNIFQGDNIIELYKSTKMIKETLLTEINYNGTKELLINRYISFNKLRERWVKKPELLKITFNNISTPNRLRDSIVTSIVLDIGKNYLSVVKPDKKLSIIKVDVKAKDEVFAKNFNEQLVNNVNNFYLQTKTKKSLQNVKIMQHKTDSVRAVMNGAIYTAVEAIDATPNLNPTRQVQRMVPSQRAQFSAETNKAILGYLVQNLEMAKVSLMKETPLLEVIDKPVYPLGVERFGKVKGIIIGGVLFGMLSVIYLLFRRKLKMLL